VQGSVEVSTGTPFHWSADDDGGISLLLFLPDNERFPEYAVYLTGESHQIPALESLGMGLPSGAVYAWGVARLFPVASLDAYASLEEVEPAPLEVGTGLSEIRVFLTGLEGAASRVTGQLTPSGSLEQRLSTRLGSLTREFELQMQRRAAARHDADQSSTQRSVANE
jgi:hypothetical protein